MARIKIKCRNPNNKDKKLKLIEILCRRDIEILRIFNTFDGFAVLTINEQHADSIFSIETKQELAQNEFTPVMPPELKAKKSVIIPRVDDLIYEWSAVQIKEELEKNNSWIGEDLETVYKFPNSSTIKITFTQTKFAKKCIETGLKAFYISIPGHEIKLETYIPVKCCMRCYSLEDHFTNECPKNKDYKLCSECATEGHVWHQCREQHKKCLNCGENHSALAMKCIKRKEIIREKRLQESDKQKMTYANIVHTNLPANLPSYTLPQITREELLKINICVAHARSKNQDKPGCYAHELNRVLRANNLSNIIIPDEDRMEEGAVGGDTKAQEPEPKKQRLTLRNQSSVGDALDDSMTRKKMDAGDLGLEFFTTTSNGWPTNFSTEDLVKGIQNKIFKYTYINKRYSEDQVLRKISKGELILTNCWFAVEENEFRKIVSGLVQERTLSETRDPRLKKNLNN